MATGRKETKTPMEMAAANGKAKALTALEEYTQVDTFTFTFFSCSLTLKVSGSCFFWNSSGDSTSDVVQSAQADER